MKIWHKEKFHDSPINVLSGDIIQLAYHDGRGNKRIVMQEPITKAASYDEAIIFELEEDEVEGWSEGLGGAFGKSKEVS